MSWWAVEVRSPAAEREAVGAWLVAQTGQAIEERDDGTLVTVAADRAAADQLLDLLRAEHPAASGAGRELAVTDWSTRWRDGLAPRRFGRLTVTPSWITPPADAGGLIVLDPESAFGSGEHGSTRAALTLLERTLRPGDLVLDLGSGSGILALAAARLGAARAIGIEIDPEAAPIAQRNAERNGLTDRVTFLTGDAGALAPLLGPADLLVSNILRMVNVALLRPIVAALRPGGTAIFSGMEEDEAPLFRPVASDAGLVLTAEETDAGWWAVAAVRPR